MGYTRNISGETTARAIAKDRQISPKHSFEICRQLKGKSLEYAKKYLEEVISFQRAVPFKRFNRQVTHKRGKGFGAGRYPLKAAKELLSLIHEVEDNASYKGLEPEGMHILHIASYKARRIKGYTPRAHGRFTSKDRLQTTIEIIIGVLQDSKAILYERTGFKRNPVVPAITEEKKNGY